MIAHHHRKRRTAREAAMVQSDSQLMSAGGKTTIGDNFIRASRIDKSEHNGIWGAFSLALNELA
jgi:hypothetical protein